MQKKCSQCPSWKDEEEFPFKKKSLGIRTAYCKSCKKKMQGRWYSQNSETHRKNIKLDKQRRKEIDTPLIQKMKAETPCADCKTNYPYYVMDFDHRPGEEKNFGVSQRLNKISIERILEEIRKCDVVCANCHRTRTHERIFGSHAAVTTGSDPVVEGSTPSSRSTDSSA